MKKCIICMMLIASVLCVMACKKDKKETPTTTAKETISLLTKLDSTTYFETYEYDDANNLTKVLTYNLDEVLTAHYEYEYKPSTSLKTKMSCFDESDGSLSWYAIYEYDNNNQLISETEYESNGNAYSKYVYEYNSNGLLSKKYCYEGDETPYCIYTYIYDEKKNPLFVNCYDKNDNLTSKMSYEYSYDNKGNIIKYKEMDSDNLILWYEATYNDKGDRISYKTLNASGVAQSYLTYSIEYDSKGNITKHSSKDAYGNVSLSIDYAYDEYGNVTSEITYDATGNIVAWNYKTYSYK